MDINSTNIRPSVLIADDDNSTRMLLRASITQWNCPVIEAKDGEEALSILSSSNAPRIATIDWMMPKISGIDLCKELKKMDEPPYIILLTSMSGSTNLINALDAGADDFIAKPFSHAELRSRLFVGIRTVLYEIYLKNIIKNKSKKFVDDILKISKNMSENNKILKNIIKDFSCKSDHNGVINDLERVQSQFSAEINRVNKLISDNWKSHEK